MTENAEKVEAEATTAPVEDLERARRGLRSCFACRTAFPNHLSLLKHEVQGCGGPRRRR